MVTGVEILSDLQDFYSDASMLNEFKEKASQIEFRRFLRAASKTQALRHIIIPPPFGLVTETTSGTLPKPPTASTMPTWEVPAPPMVSTYSELEEEEKKLRDEIEALKKSKLSATALRIEKLKQEKAEIELDELTAHRSRTELERTHAEELKKIKNRKSLIDSKIFEIFVLL